MQYLERFHLPHIKPYDGQKDPSEHIEHYLSLMKVKRTPDGILCRTFPPTLHSAPRRWFRLLCPHSISSFYELSREFILHFSSVKQIGRLVVYLLSVKQREKESLRGLHKTLQR